MSSANGRRSRFGLAYSTALPRCPDMIASPDNSCLRALRPCPRQRWSRPRRSDNHASNTTMLSGLDRLSGIFGETSGWLPRNKPCDLLFINQLPSSSPRRVLNAETFADELHRGMDTNNMNFSYKSSSINWSTPFPYGAISPPALQDTSNFLQDAFWPEIWNSSPYQLQNTTTSSSLLRCDVPMK
jgi:hypothetical protein